MLYKLNQKVHCAGKKCLILATKELPHKPEVDPYNRTEIYPEKDYLLTILKEIKNNKAHYLGTLDVYENQIENTEW